MAIIKINTDICFECGKPSEEMHHVIPKSKGGKKTIPLCIECHGKAHDISNRRLFLDKAKEARKRYVLNGGKLGRKVGSKETNDDLLIKHTDIVFNLLQGNTIRKTMLMTGKSSGTVQKIKKIINNNKL